MQTISRIASSLPVLASLLAATALAGCNSPSSSPEPELGLQEKYWEALKSHCGQAYAGQLVSNDAADADFQGAEMVMHVRDCSDFQIAIPFHVRQKGKEWDRSRTWVITRFNSETRYPGLRLKHDHRHEDGTEDAVTMYGGETLDDGSARSQSYPVDAESIVMFEREGLDASVTNVWTVEVHSAEADGVEDGEGKADGTDTGETDTGETEAGSPKFVYQLQRTVAGGAPENRLFRVEFDLSKPVPAPPAPWGQ